MNITAEAGWSQCSIRRLLRCVAGMVILFDKRLADEVEVCEASESDMERDVEESISALWLSI